MKKDKASYFLYAIIFIISCILFLSYIHPTFNIDEEYSMGLIQHNYKQLININMLDVHPPTYYLLLKFFLRLTTFWTNSILIKVLFGHLLSLFAFIISFIFLHKIINFTGYNINWISQLIIYLLLCPISMYATTIRMHGFSALFNILELYYLIKFTKNYSNKNLLLACLWAIIASYTDYFSAVSAGVFIFIYFIIYTIKKNKVCSIKLLLTGCIYFIVNVPLIIIGYIQILNRQKFSTPTSLTTDIKALIESLTQSGGIQTILTILPILLLFIWSINNLNNKFNTILLITLTNYIISNILAIFTCMRINVYEFKLVYPQFSIYAFFLITTLILIIKKSNFTSKFAIIIIILLCLSSFTVINKNIKRYVLPSIQFSKQIHKSQKLPYKILNFNKIPKYWPESQGQPKQIYIIQESNYLPHKEIIIKNDNISKAAVTLNHNINLFKKVYPNIKYK